MASTAPSAQTLIEGEVLGFREEQANDTAGGRTQQAEEDGGTWKKYGKKFIRGQNIIRSYYKCQKGNCRAKKRVEWPPSDPSDFTVIYDGRHDHPSPNGPQSSQQDSRVNDYNLVSQVFGPTNNLS